MEIEHYCQGQGHTLLGLLPYDESVVRAMVQGKCVTELPETPFSRALRGVWEQIASLPDKDAQGPSPFINAQRN